MEATSPSTDPGNGTADSGPFDPAPASRRRTPSIPAAVLAVVAVLGVLFLAGSSLVSAQSSNETDSEPSAEVTTTEDTSAEDTAVEVTEAEPDFEVEADEHDDAQHLAMHAEWDAYDACLADNGADFSEFDQPNPDFESIDIEAIEAAEEACEELVPDEVKELDAAFEAFDTCLADNGLDTESFGAVLGSEVDFDELDLMGPPPAGASIWTEDGMTFADFGDEDGTITITKTDGVISVEGTGDVSIEEIDHDSMFMDGPAAMVLDGASGSILDGAVTTFIEGPAGEAGDFIIGGAEVFGPEDAEFSAAFTACEQHLPMAEMGELASAEAMVFDFATAEDN